MMSLELAWAAGFFDGEGTVYCRKTARHKGGTTGRMYPLTTPEISIAQVRPEPLIRFHEALGIGRVAGPYQPKAKTHSPYFRWQTAGRPHVHQVACLLWPYLSLPKREQFLETWAALAAARTVKSPYLPELPE